MTTYREMIGELNTELSYRKHVYPRLVAARKMTQVNADRRMNILAAIIAEIEPLAAAEKAEAEAEQEVLEPRLL